MTNINFDWIPKHFRKPMSWREVKGNQSLAEWAKSKQQFLIISGKTGSGKTHSAIALVKNMQEFAGRRFRSHTIKFINFGEYYRQYIEKIQTRGIYELNRQLIECDILILDDFGLIKLPPDSFTDILYSIIDQRLREEKRTIITTNFEEKKILEFFTERIHSRIFSGTSLNFAGEDKRLATNF